MGYSKDQGVNINFDAKINLIIELRVRLQPIFTRKSSMLSGILEHEGNLIPQTPLRLHPLARSCIRANTFDIGFKTTKPSDTSAHIPQLPDPGAGNPPGLDRPPAASRATS